MVLCDIQKRDIRFTNIYLEQLTKSSVGCVCVLKDCRDVTSWPKHGKNQSPFLDGTWRHQRSACGPYLPRNQLKQPVWKAEAYIKSGSYPWGNLGPSFTSGGMSKALAMIRRQISKHSWQNSFATWKTVRHRALAYPWKCRSILLLRFDKLAWLEYSVEARYVPSSPLYYNIAIDIWKVGGACPVVSILAERNRTTPADRKRSCDKLAHRLNGFVTL